MEIDRINGVLPLLLTQDLLGCEAEPEPGPPAVDVSQNLGLSADATSTIDSAFVADGQTLDGATDDDALTPCPQGGGCFGEPCDDSTGCFSEVCASHLGEMACSKTCDEDRPQGWYCSVVEMGGPDPVQICGSPRGVTAGCYRIRPAPAAHDHATS
jgi:hypothetical protein